MQKCVVWNDDIDTNNNKKEEERRDEEEVRAVELNE